MHDLLYRIPKNFIEKWQNIADLLAKVVNVPSALIMKTENEFMEVLISSDSESNPYHPGDKEHWHGLYCETVIKSQKELHVSDALKDKNWDKNPDIKLGMIAYLGIPINFPDKHPFGTICVLDKKENEFSPENKALLYQFKNVIELDLALIQTLDWNKKNEDFDIIHKLQEQNEEYLAISEEIYEAKEKAEQSQEYLQEQKNEIEINNARLESLLKISQFQTNNVQELLDFALHEAIDLTRSKIGYIYFYREKTQQFLLNTWSKDVMKECAVVEPQTIYDLDKTGCWGEAVRQRKPIVINDYQAANPLKKGTPKGHVQLKKFLTIPVIIDNEVLAVCGVANKTTDYEDSDIRQLTLLMDSVWKISERIRLIKDLVDAKENAEESEGKLKEAQRIAQMGNWELNVETNELFWSDEIFRIFDCEPQEFNATYEAFLDFIHPDDRAKVNSAYLNSLETKSAYQIEHRLITKSHKIKYVIEKCTTTFNEQGKPLNSFGIVIDITEQKALQNALIKAKEKAQESERLKSAFLANMSHEIRTPMNGILGFADLLKEPDLAGDEQHKYIGVIEESGKRMLNIINDIIDVSKIESGQMELNMKETNVNEQIEFIYTFFQPDALAKGIKLSFKNPLPAQEATIKTDREKLYAILTNLVKNAMKFTEKGSIELAYKLKTDTKPGELEFYVKDTGIGIPKDRQEAIFDRFIQADIANQMAHKGSGLGLAISKAYVEMLGGKIWVESVEGKGSIFYFTLPYNTGPAAETIDRKLESSGKNDDIRKLKILIAEDDEVSEMLLDKAVKMFGKEILKARTGFEVVELCRNNPDIDLILMDIRMPGMDGYEATQQIREFNKEVIIIAQTAYGLSVDREKSIESGCNDYIAKPINKEKLFGLINKHLKVK